MKTKTIDELERLEKDATDLRWYALSDGVVYVDVEGKPCMVADCNSSDDDCMADHDAALIAAARNAMPDLLRIARDEPKHAALRAEVERLLEVHGEDAPKSGRIADIITCLRKALKETL